MKKLFLILLALLGLTNLSSAAVTYNGSAKLDNAASVSFNNTGSSETMLVVGIFTSGAVRGSVSTVTYNGAYLTQAVAQSGTNRTVYLFYKAGPASGSNTLQVNFGTVPTDYKVMVASYDNVTGLGLTDGATPSSNTTLSIGGVATAPNWSVYLAGAKGVAPSITNTALTVRQELTYTAASDYMFGDTTITAKQLFTATDSGTFGLTGVMLELQTTPYTSTPTATPSATRTDTPTWTPTATPTETKTITETSTPTGTPSITKTITESHTASPTRTASPTPSVTLSTTKTITPTNTPTMVPINWQSNAVKVAPIRPLNCVDVNLMAGTAWTSVNPGCGTQPCIMDVAVPHSAAYTLSYHRSLASTTPTVNGATLAPGGQVSLSIRPGEILHFKFGAASTVSSTGQVCQ